MRIDAQVIKYGDDVSTDLIYPGRYTYLLLSEEEMGSHALEDLDPGLGQRDISGCVIVAGKNWGCGSAREQAVKCLKARGVRAVIAGSIARIYYRNSINEGLLPVVCPEAASALDNGDRISIDLEKGLINSEKGSFTFPQFPDFVLGILNSGGLIAQVRKETAGKTGEQRGRTDG